MLLHVLIVGVAEVGVAFATKTSADGCSILTFRTASDSSKLFHESLTLSAPEVASCVVVPFKIDDDPRAFA